MSDIFIPFGGGGSIKTPDGKEYVANVVPVLEELHVGLGQLADIIRAKSTANLSILHGLYPKNIFKDGDYFYLLSPSTTQTKAFVSKWSVSPLECLAVTELISGAIHNYGYVCACHGEDFFFVQAASALTTEPILFKIQKSSLTVVGSVASGYKSSGIVTNNGGPWNLGDYIYMIGDKTIGQLLKIKKSDMTVQSFTLNPIIDAAALAVNEESSAGNIILCEINNTQAIKTFTFYRYNTNLVLLGSQTIDSPLAQNINPTANDMNIPGFLTIYNHIFDIRGAVIKLVRNVITNMYPVSSMMFSRGIEPHKCFCFSYTPAYPGNPSDTTLSRQCIEIDFDKMTYELIAVRERDTAAARTLIPEFLSKEEVLSLLQDGLPAILAQNSGSNSYGRLLAKSQTRNYVYYTEKR